MSANFLNLVFILCNLRLVVSFWLKVRALPNIALPKTLHEKYLWRKIVERDPRYVCFSDKLLCKKYMAGHFPEVKCASVLWRGHDIRHAPQDLLVKPGYLKANHASGYNHRLGICEPNLRELHQTTQSWLRRKWHRIHGEWGYRDVRPELFIEEDVGRQADRHQLIDLTVYVFDGYISHIAAMSDHKTDEARFGRFDVSGHRLKLGEYPTARMERLARGPNTGAPNELPDDFSLPDGLDQVLQIARRIAKGFDHLRVDFMCAGEAFWFSEITIYSQGGFLLYSDQDLLQRMADAWDLRLSWLLTYPQKGWRKYYASWLRKKLDFGQCKI